MVTALESKAALVLLTGAAVASGAELLNQTSGSFEERRLQLLDTVPALIGYYADGSSALAADFYEDERDRWSPPGYYVAEPIVADRTVKIRRAVAWAADPLSEDNLGEAESRLAEVIDLETARPYRDTILGNRRRDKSCVGWQRVTSGGCKLCRMLADRGAVYKESTVRFAAHPHCKCTAQPVFLNGAVGEEASAMQYIASSRRRTKEQKAALREYLNDNYPDVHG